MTKGQVDWRSPDLGERREIGTTVGRVVYHEAGSGQPLVFIHGFLCNANLWRKLVPRLADRFRCLTVDWPLGSHFIPVKPTADLSPPGIVSLIGEFLDRLELTDVVVLGNDSGGAYAQMLAAADQRRLAALVLNSCETPEDTWLPKGFGNLKRAGQIPGGLRFVMQPLRHPRAWRSSIAYGRLAKRSIDAEVMWSFLEPFFTPTEIRYDASKVISAVGPEYHRHAADVLISEFEKPVIFAWGAEDEVFPIAHAETYAAALAGSQLEEIPDSYTYAAEDNPTSLAQVLIATLTAAAAG